MKCCICKSLKKTIQKHHLNYKENITIPICIPCHRKIHFTNEYPSLKSIDASNYGQFIRITSDVKKALDKKGLFNESYNDVISRLLKLKKVKK